MEYKTSTRLLELEKELYRRDAARRFSVFLDYAQPAYSRQWFHTLIADRCQALLEGTLQHSKLMIFMPPQHGKSEIVSRKFPAWALGKNPLLKIVGTSYSADLAQQFSRAIQRTIDSPEYGEVFPNTFLNNQRVKTDTQRGWLRNVDMFETVGYGGFFKAVGVGGSLTGTPADLGIIDDPIKDAMEANSDTFRNRVWEWYTDVFLTRMHNDSKIILIQTRWHADDLAGRLIEREGDEWTIVNIPALREENAMEEDPREIGEALWEERHSRERLLEVEQRSPRTFAALYQQRPSVEGGNIVKRDWFGHISQSDFYSLRYNEPVHFFLDTAYEEKKAKADNDPSGILGACMINNTLYVVDAMKVYKNMPDLLRFLPDYMDAHYGSSESMLHVEPKANGKSVVQMLRETSTMNVCETTSPSDSKETRFKVVSPRIECGRVVLVEGAWNEPFLDEVCGFPAVKHDEYVDILGYAINYFFSDEYDVTDYSSWTKESLGLR